MAEITEQVDEQQPQTSEAAAEQTTASNLSAGGDVGQKFSVAKDKKEAGDEAFKQNDLDGGECPAICAAPASFCLRLPLCVALRNYHEVCQNGCCCGEVLY